MISLSYNCVLLVSCFCCQASGHAPAALQAKLPTYLKDAQAFVTEGLEADAEPQPRQQTLGELLLGLPPPQATPSHLSDAGLVLDHPPQPLAAAGMQQQQPAQAAATAAAPEPLQQQHRPGGSEGEDEQQDEQSIAAMLQESLLQADGSTNRAELEAMLLRCVGAAVYA